MNVFIYSCVSAEITSKERKKNPNFTENEPFRSSHISSVTVAKKKIENISWPKVEKNFKWKGAGGLESILIFISHSLYWYKFLLPFSLFLVGKKFCGLIATNSGRKNVLSVYLQQLRTTSKKILSCLHKAVNFNV